MPVKHIAQCAPQLIHIGVPYMYAAIYSLVSLLAGFGLGWYVKGRGWFGVKVDATNAVTEIKSL